MTLTTWSGSYVFAAQAVHRPDSLEQAQQLVADARHIRALGSRHSFNDLADAPELISLTKIPFPLQIDEAGGTAVVGGASTYGEVSEQLTQRGFALHAMASLPHISIAGAIATGTHGSGDRSGSLASAVVALEYIAHDGELKQTHRGDPYFAAMVVSLGGLGIVTRVWMRIEPSYDVRQHVFNEVPWAMITEDFDAFTALGDSVGIFTDWSAQVADSVWIKRRADNDDGGAQPARLASYAATENQHPVRSRDGSTATQQLGVPGPWHERLPHFRLGFTPSAGQEIQVEYLLGREDAAAAIDALRPLKPLLDPVLQISEIRTIAGDDLWLSPAYDRDSISIHFTFDPRPDQVRALLPRIDEALAPFGARPHWGKWFSTSATILDQVYPLLPQFRALSRRLDPQGCFRNDYWDRVGL